MRTLTLALTLALTTPALGAAQDVLGVSLGGGFAFAAGDVTATHGNGPMFAARTFFPFSPRLTGQLSIGYHEVRLKQDVEARRRGHNWDEFRLGGGYVEGGDRRSLGVLTEAQFHLFPRTARISPYVLAGAGVSQVRVPDLTVYFLGRWDQDPGSAQIALGADIGGGVQLRLTRSAGIIAQASYLTLFTDAGRTTMVPTYLGLLVELGAR